MGFRFYDFDGKLIYESACKFAFTNSKHEILLQDGEKILGFVSRERIYPGYNYLFDF